MINGKLYDDFKCFTKKLTLDRESLSVSQEKLYADIYIFKLMFKKCYVTTMFYNRTNYDINKIYKPVKTENTERCLLLERISEYVMTTVLVV